MITSIEKRNRYEKNDFSWERILENRIPYCYQPERLQYPRNDFDKIFASCWIEEDKIAIGTKDNQLTIWDIYKNSLQQIRLPNTKISFDRGCGIHDIDFIQTKDHGLLVSGSDSPNDIALFETKSFKPIGLLQNHSDWVFGCKFINEKSLFSGGKDGCLCFWKLNSFQKENEFFQNEFIHEFQEQNLNEEEHNEFKEKQEKRIPIIHPYGEYMTDDTKIRCVSVEKTRKLCYSLHTNGIVGIWDAETMNHIQNELLDDYFELITMDVKEEDNLIAVGSRSYTSLIDPRSNEDTFCINHVDLNWGVRKVVFLNNYLIIGGGSGVISFVDLRKPNQLHHCIYHKCNGLIRNGFLDMNENEIPQAVYTISYNTSKTNLFVGGGPLLVGVSGYFGSVWN